MDVIPDALVKRLAARRIDQRLLIKFSGLSRCFVIVFFYRANTSISLHHSFPALFDDVFFFFSRIIGSRIHHKPGVYG